VGVSARVSVLIYNPSLISASQLPTTALQMASPKYKGKLAFAAGETDFQPIVTSVARTYGQARALSWLEGIKANAGSHVYPDNETIADEVNRGAVAFGVVNQYYWYRMRAELGAANVHSKITHFAPHDPGYVLDVSDAAVLKSAKNQADAQKFLAFLVSKQGQEIIAHSISFEYPLDDGVQTAAPETPFSQPSAQPQQHSRTPTRTRPADRTCLGADRDALAAATGAVHQAGYLPRRPASRTRRPRGTADLKRWSTLSPLQPLSARRAPDVNQASSGFRDLHGRPMLVRFRTLPYHDTGRLRCWKSPG